MSTKATIAWIDENGPDEEHLRGVHVYRDTAEARPRRVHIDMYGEEGSTSIALTEESWKSLRQQIVDGKQ
jgi:hypothetical protein